MPRTATNENSVFPSSFHNDSYFSHALLSEDLFGAFRLSNPAENEKITLWEVKKQKNKFNGWKTLLNLTMLLFLVALMSLEKQFIFI